MKKSFFFLIVIFVLVITGCASKAMPNNIAGKFYMAGDSNCVQYRQLTNSRIMCIDENGREVGYRDAMTDQELQMYMHNRTIEQQQSAQLSQSLDNLNNQLNYNNQQQLNRMNTYKVKPIGPYGY